VAYAVYTGDEYYHLLERASSLRTLCGLPTIRRRGRVGEDEYHPPARVTVEQPPAGQYRSCPLCAAASNELKSKREGTAE
jgi:hypothetical protein